MLFLRFVTVSSMIVAPLPIGWTNLKSTITSLDVFQSRTRTMFYRSLISFLIVAKLCLSTLFCSHFLCVVVNVLIIWTLLRLLFSNSNETMSFELMTPAKTGALPTELNPYELFSQISSMLFFLISLYYICNSQLMGLNGLEPSTSRLSGVRSNQLSYKPICVIRLITGNPW